MSIEIRHITHIQSISQHGSFTKAAESLGLTQSALSRSIINLEEELKVTLFERGRGKLNITPLGELVLKRGQRVLIELDDLQQEIENFKGHSGGHVNAAFEAGASHLIMGDLLVNLHKNHPDIHVNSTTGAPSILIKDTLKGDYDILISPTSYVYGVKGIAVEVGKTFQARVIVRADHPLTQLANANLGDILRYPYVGYKFSPSLYEHWAVDPSVKMTPATLHDNLDEINTDNIPSICKILMETDAFTWGIASFFPEELLAGKLVLLDLPNTPIEIEVGISYPANRYLPPAVQAFKEETNRQLHLLFEKEEELVRCIAHPKD